MRNYISLLILLPALCLFQSCDKNPNVVKSIIIDGSIGYQTIDGFGTNVTPALWQDGKLKPALDLLVDDLGATEFRFDAYGLANWLNPDSAKADGSYSEAYLKSVYTSRVFNDAWATFRYLNSKGIEPFFNISGRVPPEWNEPGTLILQNFDAYSTMVCSMLQWAREKESLKFSKITPFNETDFDGSREGPAIPTRNRVKALTSMLNKLNEYGFGDLKVIAFCDAEFKTEYIKPIIEDSSFVSKIYAFSGHTYGAGGEGDGEGWYTIPSRSGVIRQMLDASLYKKSKVWLTEFGDLDQSNEIESEFAWRMSRRLQKGLTDGVNGFLTWDGYDNYHLHDTAWATYGLLKTDTLQRSYTPKGRYYAMKQTFRFVKPGFQRIEVKSANEKKDYYVYKEWTADLKNISMQAFLSPDKKDVTLVGMSLVDSDVRVYVSVPLMDENLKGRKFQCLVTNKNNNCKKLDEKVYDGKQLYFDIPEGRTIFTITTIY